MSHAQRVIPEGVQNWWHDFRQRFQTSKQEGELEIVGHGVEEASQRSKQEGASEYLSILDFLTLITHPVPP